MSQMNGDEPIYRIFAAAVQGPEFLKHALLDDVEQLCSITDFSIPPDEVSGSRNGRRFIVQTQRRIGFLTILKDLVENGLVSGDDIAEVQGLLDRDGYLFSGDDPGKIERELRILLG